jgi:MFS family permease
MQDKQILKIIIIMISCNTIKVLMKIEKTIPEEKMKINSLINELYFNDKKLHKRDYEKSRKYFLFEGSSAVGIFSLTSGAFLAGFARYLGATDEFNGIIGAIPTMAGIVQILSSLVFEKLKYRKFLISILCLAYRLLLGFMIFIPVFIQDTTARLVVLAVTYFIAYCLAAFITPAASGWMVDLTPEHMRGSYFAIKDAVSLAFVTILTLVMGKVLDVYRKSNNEYGGFIVLAVVVMILSVINFYFLSIVREPIVNRKTTKISLKNVVIMAIKNTGFRKVIIMSILWNIALQVGGPFISVYMVTGLKLSYSYIMIMGVLSSGVRVLVAKIWGSLGDRRSWAFVAKVSIAMVGINHFTWTFVNSDTSFVLVPLLHILGGIGWSGIAISLFNIQFVYAPEEGRTAYLGTSAALGGVFGFISTYIGATLVNVFKKHHVGITSLNIIGIQFVFALSGILILITALYIHLFMKQKRS